MEEGTHAELMKIDVVKGKTKKSADDTDKAAETKGQETSTDSTASAVDAATSVGGEKASTVENQAGGQAKNPAGNEEVTLSGFYHLMWDTQMVR